MQITEKTGNLVAIKSVNDEDDLIITSKGGIIIRLGIDSIRVMGRATQGVRVIKLRATDAIADVAVIVKGDDDTDEEE